MCAQYIVDKTGKELARFFGALAKKVGAAARGRVVPHTPAPVVVGEGGRRALTEMRFGLIPAWSKEERVKFATHNARLESVDEKTRKSIPIYQKPTWKEPFLKRHCLVPMTSFIEPLYTGPLAGNMVAFRPASGDVFVAAGLWEEWVSKASGEVVQSFTILTDEPVPHIARMGHDRTPVFLPEDKFDAWLDAGAQKPEGWIKFLRTERADIPWTEDIDRPLAKGWEKRA